uniref:Uncharacterized protein n=1 Tax=Rhodosorus marinus TaxID=101924 RepID=A0A7S0G296_9RHOD
MIKTIVFSWICLAFPSYIHGMAFICASNVYAKRLRSCTGMGVDLPDRQFRTNLDRLPDSDGVEKIELLAVGRRAVRRGELDAVIRNISGQRGSIAVYNALFQKYKIIDKRAAQEGLELYAEKWNDAKENPGKHPNIDRLMLVVSEDMTLVGKINGKYSS